MEGVVNGVVISDSSIEGHIHISQSNSYQKRVVEGIDIINSRIKSEDTYGVNIINRAGKVSVINCDVVTSTTDPEGGVNPHGIRIFKSDDNFIQNTNITGDGSNNGVFLEDVSNNNRISGCEIAGAVIGVSVQSGVSNSIIGNSVKDCTTGVLTYGKKTSIKGNNFEDISGYYIRAEGADQTEVENNILDCENSNEGQQAVLLNSIRFGVIKGNMVVNGGQKSGGIRLQISSNSLIDSNLVEGTGNAIYCNGVGDIIKNNRISEANIRGMWLYSRESSIIGNYVTGSEGSGIEFNSGKHNYISENYIKDSGSTSSVRLTGQSEYNRVFNNTIVNTKTSPISYAIENGQQSSNNKISNNTIEGDFTTIVNRRTQNDVVDDIMALASTSEKGLVMKSTSISDSTASDLSEVVGDFNNLLSKLRTAGLLEE